MFESLDFIDLPTGDVDTAAAHHQRMLGAELLWEVRGMDTYALYQRTSPHTDEHFAGRIDE